MPQVRTSEVSRQTLESKFQDEDIWGGIRSGRLSSVPAPGSVVPSHSWSNATSKILQHYGPDGKHIATTHCVIDSDGWPVHWDAKDLIVDGIRLWRR